MFTTFQNNLREAQYEIPDILNESNAYFFLAAIICKPGHTKVHVVFCSIAGGH